VKKLLLLLFSLTLSFNSYGEWVELGVSDGVSGFIELDAIKERSDGHVYWWMMLSDVNESEKYHFKSDCEGERTYLLQYDFHTEPMGGGEVSSTNPDAGWQYHAPDTKMNFFIKFVCGLAKGTLQERQTSIEEFLDFINE
tara:strand:+ start:230 stop:649 length:420 start_codon:yes stop_codon:yes gene_type:complete